MSKEKTIEELQAELTKIKKENLQRQIDAEMAKVAESEALKKKEEEEAYRKQIYEEEHERVLKDLAKEHTKVELEKIEQMKPQTKVARFKDRFVANMNRKFKDEGTLTSKHQYTGKTYEERIKDLVDGPDEW